MIDYAEALTVIDVNSGSFTGRGKGGLEETITRVNTEAADEDGRASCACATSAASSSSTSSTWRGAATARRC